MINGAHVIICSKVPRKDRAFFRDVLKLTNVDVGDGWLIFGLPPSEVAIHPHTKNDRHELYLMCEDIAKFRLGMKRRKVDCGPVQDQGWGLLTKLALPGGGTIGVYEPRHARPRMFGAHGAGRSKAARKRTSTHIAKTRTKKIRFV